MSKTNAEIGFSETIATLEQQLEEAKLREQQLRDETEFLNHILDLSGTGEWEIDLQTGEVNVSERWWRLLGYEKGEYDEHLDNMKQLHYPSDWEKGWDKIALHLQGKTPLYENELRYLAKDQTWQWFRVVGKVISRDSTGEPLIFAGVVQSIKPQKKLAEDLRKTRDELQQHISQQDLDLSEMSHNLDDALREISSLSGILPICSCCKKIRDDKGYWEQLEDYIETHSEALFSHGLCELCHENLYRDEGWYQRYQERLAEGKITEKGAPKDEK